MPMECLPYRLHLPSGPYVFNSVNSRLLRPRIINLSNFKSLQKNGVKHFYYCDCLAILQRYDKSTLVEATLIDYTHLTSVCVC